jgi:hypothetical protein
VATRPKRKPNPPKPNPPKHPYPKPERLEARPWWPEFLAERGRRIAAERAAEQAIRDRAEAALWAAVRRAGETEPLVSTDNSKIVNHFVFNSPSFRTGSETPPSVVSTDNSKSLTLRERFLSKAACA